MVKYLGEEGADTPIAAAVSMCNPFDLVSLFTSCPSVPCLACTQISKIKIMPEVITSADLIIAQAAGQATGLMNATIFMYIHQQC